jgi:hypothetical protein
MAMWAEVSEAIDTAAHGFVAILAGLRQKQHDDGLSQKSDRILS